ncbi:hypothetical protein KBC03_06170 [Patescibacteria group bacterium]|nr:hypothetical protein [Patescibacteria group bacterium]
MGFKGIDNKEIKVDVKNTKSSRDAMKRLFDVYLNNLPTEERAEIDRELKSLKETQDKEIAGVVEAFSAEQKKLYQEIVQGFLYNMRSSVETIPVDVMHTRVGEFLTNASSQTNFAVEMKADIVLPLQIALCRWKDGIVKIDGIYGPQFQNALIQYQKEVLKDQTEGVQKRTLQSLNSFLNPERNPNVTVAVNREIEKQEMKNIASDKLQNTGDKLFQEKRIEDAGNYYTTAAVKRANAPQDVDRTKMDEKEKDLDPVSVSTIKKYIRVANNLMDDALRHPNSTAQFKADIYSEASKLLILARNVDPYACNIILRNRKRIDNQPTHTSEESDRIRKTAEENLIRVQNSLHDATYGVRGKVIDEKTKEEKPVQIKPPQPAKVPVWMKQVAYREKELAKARVFNNSFDRVIDDPNTPRGNMTTIQAYLDNYL